MVKVKVIRYAFLAFYIACALSCGSSNSTKREIVAISYAGDLQVPHRKFLDDPFVAAHPGVGVSLIP